MIQHDLLFNKSFKNCISEQQNNPAFYFFQKFFEDYNIDISSNAYLYDYTFNHDNYEVDNTVYFINNSNLLILNLKFNNLIYPADSYQVQIIPKSEIASITINASNINSYLPETFEAKIVLNNKQEILLNSKDCQNESKKSIIKFLQKLI